MSFLSGFFGPGIDELAAQARETPGSIMIDVRTPDGTATAISRAP